MCPKSSMLKVDIRKAFDTVTWDFVLKVLEAQGFLPLFRTWIQECISTPRFSVAVNGELAGLREKGIKTGRFYLSLPLYYGDGSTLETVRKATNNHQFRLHPKCDDPRLTHLLFADDLLVFSDGSRHSLTGITSVLHDFKLMSGLEMNSAKSEFFFGGYNEVEVSVLSGLSGIKVGAFPTRYLGLPLNPARDKYANTATFLGENHRETSRLDGKNTVLCRKSPANSFRDL